MNSRRSSLNFECARACVCVSTALLIASPSINFTSYYWINHFGGGESGVQDVCVRVCVCVCMPPTTALHPLLQGCQPV